MSNDNKPAAAPGIDLEQFRESVEAEYELARMCETPSPKSQALVAKAKQKHDRLLARIDASPKGGHAQDDRFPNGLADAVIYADAMEDAAADLYQQVLGYEADGSETGTDMLRAVLRELQNSPKGGSDLIAVVREMEHPTVDLLEAPAPDVLRAWAKRIKQATSAEVGA